MTADLRIGGLFEGYGGLTAGVQAAMGGELAWYSEIDPAASRILTHHHPDVPNLGDITAVDWSAVEPVDVLTGGFPCQDVSAAGKRAGLTPGTRSGLWSHMAYAISQLRPSLVVIENVRGLLSAEAHSDVERCTWCLGDERDVCMRALGAVLADLAGLGFDAVWCGLRASDVGAPHNRFRVFIVATDPNGSGSQRAESAAGRDLSARCVASDAGGDAVRQQPVLERRRVGETGLGWDHAPVADAQGDGRNERRPESARVERGLHAAVGGGEPASDSDGGGLAGDPERDVAAAAGLEAPLGADVDGRVLDWGQFGPAIERWQLILGRSAPAPTKTGKRGSEQLSPEFVEWMMGLPDGHVTAVPGLTRNEQLKALGNGVCPQQATAAVRFLVPLLAGLDESAAA